MGQELTQVLCPECGASGESDPQQSRWQCTKCGNGFFLRRCSACARVSYVDGLLGYRMPWPCTWCGQFNRGFSQNRDPATATAAELAAEVNPHGRQGNPPMPGTDGQERAQADELTATAVPGVPGARLPPSGRVPVAQRSGELVVRGITLSSDEVPAAPRQGQQAAWRIALAGAAVMACVAVVILLLTAGGPGPWMPAAGDGQGGATRLVQLGVGHVSAINLQSVPGKIVIVGTGPGQVTLTGQVHGTRGAPVVTTRFDQTSHVLGVSIQCAPVGTCTQNLQLGVPTDTGTILHQPGGQVLVTGLAGPLMITAANADITADGLRSSSLTAVITNGHLSAAFAVPPRQVNVTLAFAQAAVRLPGRATYQVNQEVTSGYIRTAIPEGNSASRTVTARLKSAELELLPA